MQSGFFNVWKFRSILLVSVLWTLPSAAQFGQTGQNTGSQQSSCTPGDPSCSTGDQGNIQIRSQSQTPQSTGPLDLNTGQQNQNNNTSNPQQQALTDQQIQAYELKRLPLDPPTQFQLAVANSIGKMLPIYGVSLFRNTPSTFAPVSSAPVTPDYIIGPGDELLLQAWGQITLNTRPVVDRSGNVYIPQVGAVHVAGLQYSQLHDFLKSQFARIFRNFDLNVNMGQLRAIQVFVVGQARRPGTYTISSLSTLTNALFATGGPTPQGSLRHIQLKRSGKVIVDFDLYDLLQHGDKSKDEALLPGDVIYIPPVGPQVAVAGSVNVPGIYELKSADATNVGDILEIAAGITNVTSTETVRLERIDLRQQRSITMLSLDHQGLATVLHDGDLLELSAIVAQYKDAVTLRGNVANPGRYTWKPGMRVLDLLPNKDALITRDYWLKRGMQGQPGLTYIPACPPRTPYGVPNLRYGVDPGESGEDSNWRYSPIRNPNIIGATFGSVQANQDSLNDLSDGGLDCNKPQQPSAYSQSNQYNQLNQQGQQQQQTQAQAQNLAIQGNSPNGLSPTALAGTPVDNPLDANRTTAATASLGSSVSPSTIGQFRPRYDVKLNEPDIDWSYAVVERQSKSNLTTTLVPFNLGKAVLEGDASQNVELMPGDVVTIFSKADIHVPQAEQTRFVRLEGEFISSGVYSVQPGETLRQLVRRAGGLTPDAYLYGSEFTRESTRRVQQQRLNEYIDQITLQVSTNAMNNAGRAISAQDTAAASAAQAQNQNIIASLRQARASGRIVLEVAPDSHDVDQLPDLPLEDGDRFIVPRVPSTVSVDGAVYNQNSFVYDPSRRLGEYLRSAGGINRDADKSRAFVIRASGSVISKQYSSSLRGNSFDSLRLYPGDTIVVPLNLTKGNTIRLIVDIAQILGQFGIAIAAANTFF